eukprot:765104-Hanusia_phi.AAC.7
MPGSDGRGVVLQVYGSRARVGSIDHPCTDIEGVQFTLEVRDKHGYLAESGGRVVLHGGHKKRKGLQGWGNARQSNAMEKERRTMRGRTARCGERDERHEKKTE